MVSAADPNELAEQNLDAGDIAYEDGQTLTLPAGSNTVSSGMAVTLDTSGNIQEAAAGTAAYLGIVQEEKEQSDDEYAVHIDRLPIVHEVPGGASVGDRLEPDGSGAHQVVADADETASMPIIVDVADADANLYIAVTRT